MIRGQLERRPLQGVLDQELTADFRGAAVRAFMKGVRQDWEAFSVFNPEAAEALYRADEELRVLLQLVGADLPDHFQDYFGSPDQPADKAKAKPAAKAHPTEQRKGPRAEPTTNCLIPPRKVRWAGQEVKLQNRLYHLLEFVLTRHKKGSPRPIPCQVIEEYLGRNP